MCATNATPSPARPSGPSCSPSSPPLAGIWSSRAAIRRSNPRNSSFPSSFQARAITVIVKIMAQQEQQQQHPPTEQPIPEVTQRSGDVGMRKLAAKEDLAFLMSGAKEKVDMTLAGMKGAGHIMTHPFNKEAKEEATAKTIEQKNEIADKQGRIRATAHMQLLQEKAIADGFDLGPGSGRQAATAPSLQSENGDAGYAPAPAPSSDARHLEHDVAAAASGRDGSVDSGNENEISAVGDKFSEESSDGSSRGRARALAHIPPDSQDYQSS